MLTIDALRDLIRERGIAAQSGASDLGTFGATSQTFQPISVEVGSVSLASPPATEPGTSAQPQQFGADQAPIFELGLIEGFGGGSWASLSGVPTPALPLMTFSLIAAESGEAAPSQVSEPSVQIHASSPLVSMTHLIETPATLPGMSAQPAGPAASHHMSAAQQALPVVDAVALNPIAQGIEAVAILPGDLLDKLGESLNATTAPLVDALNLAEGPALISTSSLILPGVASNIVETAGTISGDALESLAAVASTTGALTGGIMGAALDAAAEVARALPFLGEQVAPIVDDLTSPLAAALGASTATDASVAGTLGEVTLPIVQAPAPAAETLIATTVAPLAETTTRAASPLTEAVPEKLVAAPIDLAETTLDGADVPAGLTVLTDLLTADSQFAIQDAQTGADIFAPVSALPELVADIAGTAHSASGHDAIAGVDHLLDDDGALGGALGHLLDDDGGLHG